MKNQNKLNLDLANFAIIQGSMEKLLFHAKESYVTTIQSVLLPEIINLPPGDYQTIFKNIQVELRVAEIHSPEDDPIFQGGKEFSFGTIKLPFNAFTDNRGKYPSKLLTCVFYSRLYEPTQVDYEEAQIIGPPLIREKIQLIGALRQIAREQHVENFSLSYDDITIFLERYFIKPQTTPVVQKLHALTSHTAYRDAVADALSIDQAPIQSTLLAFMNRWIGTPILDEKTLKSVVLSAINDVLIHHIEDRHWTEAFWDGQRKLKHPAGDILVPKYPKNETAIQPTLHVILELSLSKLGIHVLRESDEGVGTLDFRCLYTTPDTLAISIGIEFKLAHHKEIKKGITRQLPAYLRAIGSKYGIFAVMWFKSDPKIFNEPPAYTKEDMRKWLEDEAIITSATLGLEITSSFIDASIRPTASKAP